MFEAKERQYGGVAHLGERYIRIVEVMSSSLTVSTTSRALTANKNEGVAQPVRVLA